MLHILLLCLSTLVATRAEHSCANPENDLIIRWCLQNSNCNVPDPWCITTFNLLDQPSSFKLTNRINNKVIDAVVRLGTEYVQVRGMLSLLGIEFSPEIFADILGVCEHSLSNSDTCNVVVQNNEASLRVIDE